MKIFKEINLFYEGEEEKGGIFNRFTGFLKKATGKKDTSHEDSLTLEQNGITSDQEINSTPEDKGADTKHIFDEIKEKIGSLGSAVEEKTKNKIIKLIDELGKLRDNNSKKGREEFGRKMGELLKTLVGVLTKIPEKSKELAESVKSLCERAKVSFSKMTEIATTKAKNSIEAAKEKAIATAVKAKAIGGKENQQVALSESQRLENQIKEIENQEKSTKKANDALANLLHENQETISKLQEKEAQLQKERAEREGNISIEKEKIGSNEKMIESLEKQREELYEKLKQAKTQQQIDKLMESISALDGQSAALNAQISEIENKKVEIAGQVNELKGEKQNPQDKGKSTDEVESPSPSGQNILDSKTSETEKDGPELGGL